MSIKIYNAYRIHVEQPAEICQFTKKLQEICKRHIMDYATKLIVDKTISIIDQCVLYTKNRAINNKMYHDFPKYLESLYLQANTSPQMILNQFQTNPEKVIKVDPKYMEHFYPLSATKRIILHKIETDTYRSLNLPTNLLQEITLFPISSHEFCFIAFGDILNQLLQTYIKCPGDSEFHQYLNSIHLQDYHYQNQVDKPASISKEEWNLRAQTWNRIMPSMVPAKDGTIISILPVSELTYPIFDISAKTILTHENTDKSVRCKKIAKQIIEIETIERLPIDEKDFPSAILRAIRTMNKDRVQPDHPEYQRYQTLFTTLEHILPDITEELLSQNIQEILSN